jgi:hypothetical protein
MESVTVVEPTDELMKPQPIPSYQEVPISLARIANALEDSGYRDEVRQSFRVREDVESRAAHLGKE